MDYGKILKDYNTYWDNKYMDIDLANKLINIIPKLIREIEESKEQVKFVGKLPKKPY